MDINGKTQLRQFLCLRAMRVWDDRKEQAEAAMETGG